MKRCIALLLGATVALGAFGIVRQDSELRGEQPAAMKIPAPELREIESWINSKPLQLKDLRGRVVVLHFWTFG